MDLDLVREQEEAEREAAGLAPKKPLDRPAAPIQSRHAVAPEAANAMTDAPAVPVSVPVEKQPSPAKQSVNPNRRALEPMGSGRNPGEEPAPRKRVRGLLRLFLYTAGGGVVGAILGFAAVNYFDLFADQTESFISSMAGGFALLFGLTHLLHYDH